MAWHNTPRTMYIMIRLRTTLFSAMCIMCTWSPLRAERIEQGVLASGTSFETRWYSHDSEREGPTVLIIGGMHGNEPAGHRAARQIATWSVKAGKLVVLPAANPPALAQRKRRIPGLEDDAGDLNRHFPVVEGAVLPTGPAAPELWEFVLSVEPDIVIDLHEGYGFRAAGSKSVGSSVITHRRKDDQSQSMLLSSVNADIDDPERTFVPLKTIVARSLARAAAESLNVESHIFETTTTKQPLSLRCRQHRTLVSSRLFQLGMLEDVDAAINQFVDVHDHRPKVAIYDGAGAGSASQGRHFESQLSGCRVDRIGPHDVRAGCLGQFDVVIFPGGSGSGQGKAIGEQGREAVRSFVDGGGAYVGVCAGAYLALDNYSWGLKLLPLDSFDREHWRRGQASLRVELTEKGQDVFSTHEGSELNMEFRQGPLMRTSETIGDRAEPEVLAWFRTGVDKGDADPKTMVNTPAIVRGVFGTGRVLLFSPHPEKTAGLEEWLRLALDWTTGGKAVNQGRGLPLPLP